MLTGWADLVGFGWTWPLYPKTCWATLEQIILLHGQACNFSTTLPKMATGGKAYASRSSYGRLSASTAEARVSSTGDTKRSNLLNLVAKRSFWLLPPATILFVRPLRDHSVGMVWPSLDSLSATTFSLECVRLLESLVSWNTRSRYSTVGHKVDPTDASFLVYV